MTRLEHHMALLAALGLLTCSALSLATVDRAQGADARVTALLETLGDGGLRDRLMGCLDQAPSSTRFSIGHRGAPLAHPEHTRESYLAAIGQGAGIVECDVTVTRDHALVGRHDACDLHSTTNILETPLAARCREPFTPANPASGRPAGARCCTQDLSLTEFTSLCGRLDRIDPAATTVAAYLAPGIPNPAVSGSRCGTLMTHDASIALFREQGVGMTPELKALAEPNPRVDPSSLIRYADALLAAYRGAAVAPEAVWPQSFDLDVVRHWISAHPEFAERVIWLDGRYADPAFDPDDPSTWQPTMIALRELGLHRLAPPIPVLLTVQAGHIVPTAYARAARAAGLELVTWTLERPGTLEGNSRFYFSSIREALAVEGDVFRVLDVLAQDVGVTGVFSDWPATTTFYANCMGR
jgi:glycerophosphoryl diester phosphodiesterase